MPWLAPTLDGSSMWANPGSALDRMLRAQDWVEVAGPQGPAIPPPDPGPNALVRTVNGKTANASGALTLTAGDFGALDQATADSRYNRLSSFVVIATADGVTDVASAIQAKLDAAGAAGGGTVIVPPASSVYLIGATLNIPDNVTVWAYGATIQAKAGWSGHLVQAECMKTMVKAPSGLALASTTGTLPAGTYAYQVSAVTASGETVGCVRKTITLAATGGVTLTWTAPSVPSGAGAITGYRVFGRSNAGGTERTLLGTTAAGTTTFTDSGSATPDGTTYVPATNSTFGRTANITIIGGTFDGNRANRTADFNWVDSGGHAGHVIDLQHVDHVHLTDCKVIGGIKWGIAIADFTDLTTENIEYDTGADGIHVVGPGRGWLDTNAHGHVGDDLVGMSLVEWPGYAVSEGDLTDITIRDVRGVDAPSAVRMLMGTRRTFYNILIDGVTGEYTRYRDAVTGNYTTIGNGVVFCNTDQQDATRAGGFTDSARFRRVLPDSHESNVLRLGGAFELVEVEQVWTLADDKAALSVNGATIGRLTTRRVDSRHLNAAAIATSNTSKIGSLTIDGTRQVSTSMLTVAAGATVMIQDTTVDEMLVRDSVISSGSAATGPALVLLYGATTVTLLALSGCVARNVPGLVYANGTTAVANRITLSQCRQQGGVSMVRVKSPSRVTVRDYDVAGTSNGVVYIIGAGATPVYVDLSGNPDSTTAISPYGLSWTAEAQQIRARSFTTHCGINILTRGPQDTAFNTNGSLSCGVGPVICDGTTWKHLYTGATY